MSQPPTDDRPDHVDDPLAIPRQAHDAALHGAGGADSCAADADQPTEGANPIERFAAPAKEAAGPVSARLDLIPRVQYAMHANDVQILRQLRIENRSDETLDDLFVTVRPEPAFAGELVLRLGELRSGAVHIFEPKWELDATFLDQLTERIEAKVAVEVKSAGQSVGTASGRTTVFTRSEWPGDVVYPELLAAFVMPNDGAVAALLKTAGAILEGWTGSPSFDGYQQDSPEAVLRQVAAVYGALAGESIQYVSPPASFEREGQRVRLPRQIESDKQAACLDLSLFAAAALEAAGLHPIVVLVEGHAFCGAFLEPRSWPDATTDDGARLRNEVKVSDLVVFETTTAVAGQQADFETARRIGEGHLSHDEKFRVAVDVRRARKGGVRPMASIEERRAAGASPAESAAAPSSATTFEPDATEALAARARRSSAPREVEEGPVRIETWKKKLLDLTLRNRLLNLPAKGKIVRLMVPDVAKLEDALADGSRFVIAHRPEEAGDDAVVDEGGARRKRSEQELTELLSAGQSSGTLYATLDEEALDKRLTSLRREGKTAEEEGGSSNLYLAVGLLKYFETDKSQKARVAPVVLVPVQLVQRTAREGVVLSARPEDARINVTLLRFLEDVHGIRVEGVDPPPDDGSGLDVPFIFQRFREEITGKRGWEILEEARLGMFSFSKILIWRDLDEYAGRLLESPIVHHLVETPREQFSDGVDFRDPSELDDVARSTQTYVPLSADSSQLAAILAAAEGKSFVLIGPPGTGKSQTITNLITHCLATGKTVLFVSEKMAALEVVHRRLTLVGLGDKCLELHSGKANKKEVLAQLARSLDAAEGPSPVLRDGIAQELDEHRDRLNAYVTALHRERPSGESVFGVLSRLIGLGRGPTVELGWPRIEETRADALERSRRTAAELQASAVEAVVGPLHPLTGVGHAEYSPLWEEQAAAALDGAIEALERYRGTATTLRAGLLGDCKLPEDEGWDALTDAIPLLLDAPEITADALTAPDWGARRDTARAAFETVEKVRSERAHFESRYERAAGDIGHAALLVALDAAEAKWFLPRFFAVRAWTRRLAATAAPKQPVDPITARADLERMASLEVIEREIDDKSDDLRDLFADGWRGERSDVNALSSALDQAESLRLAAEAVANACSTSVGPLLNRWAGLLPTSRGVSEELRSAMESIVAQRDAARTAASAAAALLAPLEPDPWRTLDVDRCLELARRWRESWERDRLRPWCRWQGARRGAADAGLQALVDALENGTVEAGALVDTFERSYGQTWYKHTISADAVLRDFQSESHERAIARFRELDDQLMQATHQAVQSRIAEHRRDAQTLLSGHQGGFLRREIQKQRRHRPIRTLFKEAGDLIRELRPCILMSPLSVAQFLDPSLPRFDAVVFDEASQMPVWDAIGAIARGNQLIVVGDPKQLPPTNFFGRTVEDDEGGAGGEDAVEDLESVLDECLASNLDPHTLSWHYRSRHESLIAFSNRHYYEGKLITFPAAINEGFGVSWRPVADGVYDFGKSRTNRREAEEVVAEIVRRLNDTELSKLSIGVVTLSQAQQSLVEDLLDAARRKHPELERFFDSDAREPVFVKNLENVQGDERDVILFTICYGPDLTGKVRMNFGPLNKEGGWRRLNVAISRARREMVIFSTLRADQIDLNRTRSEGVRDLRRFLEFVERGDAAFAAELSTDLTAEHDSPFEAEVCTELERRGWTVHRQVGCSGYRIDLAVVDPERPGRYLLGVECDGASYHSAPSARDRDKLRHELLEGLGWTLHRIWSSDWWENHEREVGELIAALEEAQSRRRVEDESGASAADAIEQLGPEESVAPGEPGEARYAGAAVVAEREATTALPDAPTTAAERVEQVLAGLADDPARFHGRLEFYRPTAERTVGDRSSFYRPESTDEIAATLKTVVHDEGPIVAELAARRVGQLWGYSHLKGTGIEHVLAHVLAARVHLTAVRDERVLWPTAESSSTRPPARVARDDRSERSIDQIPLVELAALLRFWVEEGGPIPERDLFDHALRTIGLRKLGKQIRTRLEQALDVGAAVGWLDARDGVIRLGGVE